MEGCERGVLESTGIFRQARPPKPDFKSPFLQVTFGVFPTQARPAIGSPGFFLAVTLLPGTRPSSSFPFPAPQPPATMQRGVVVLSSL
jgi:hypothetical protein